MTKTIVIVESPSKAKAIGGYLGDGYYVLASNGHVRNISPRSGAVEPNNNFYTHYDVPEKSKKQLSAIEKAIKTTKCKTLYIATDPDREGEAIGWHIIALLDADKMLHNIQVKRISFNEITKKAIQKAINEPRDIDQCLVDAQRARSALDYLIGFNISPVLWRKLPGSRSAGRVQSVALRMICDREQEIASFTPQEYWSMFGLFRTNRNTEATAQLVVCNGKKLEKLDIANAEQVSIIRNDVINRKYKVSSIKKQIIHKNPNPPFITSTLQQDASRKLGFSPSRTMRAAQKLYEGIKVGSDLVGLITYMRTDGLYMSDDAIVSIRQYVEKTMGSHYIPSIKREYKKKVKNAQEAHEAIRPTDVRRTPNTMRDVLSGDELALYELIWKRAVAAQMESAQYERVTVEIESTDAKYLFRITGSKQIFDGFLRIMPQNEDGYVEIDILETDEINLTEIIDKQHWTEPQPRFSEASLIANLEELGIGRPSTYAAIINVLHDREYIENKGRILYATTRGKVVAAFLKNFFAKYVEYDFTAHLEDELDSISNGNINWTDFLRFFWSGFEPNVLSVMETKPDDIMNVLEKDADYIEHNLSLGQCKQCHAGALRLRVSKYGPYLCCSKYPECNYSKTINDDKDGKEATIYPKILGNDPETGEEISLRNGQYGLYIQVGDANNEKKSRAKKGEKKAEKKVKPKRVGIPKNITPETIDLFTALKLLSLPMSLGKHPDTGEEIKVGSGIFGPYLHYKNCYISIPPRYSFLDLEMKEALDILSKSRKLKKKDSV